MRLTVPPTAGAGSARRLRVAFLSHIITGGGAPPPPRTYADASPSAPHGRRRWHYHWRRGPTPGPRRGSRARVASPPRTDAKQTLSPVSLRAAGRRSPV